MATNNAINLATAGIVYYDGAGTFTALANPLTIANGGSARASTTAYAVLCGGTTSTGAQQSIASLGSADQCLTSNGAGALPTMQDQGGYMIYIDGLNGLFPSDSTDYYQVVGFSTTGSAGLNIASSRSYIPKSGILTAVYGAFTIGSPGTNESSTLRIRLNDTTDLTVSNTIDMSASPALFNNTFSQAVTAGDYINVIWDSPAWATNPQGVRFTISIYIK